MTLLAHITDRCKEEAQTHGVLDEIEKLAERIEKTQSTSSFDKFPQPYLVKKKVGGRQHRLIAQQTEIGEFVVISFLSIMIRSGRDYDGPLGFGKDPEGYGQRHFSGLVTDDVLAEYIEGRRGSPPPPLSKVSEHEYELLYGGFVRSESDDSLVMIYDTESWIAAINQPSVAAYLSVIADAVLQAFEGPHGRYDKNIARDTWTISYLKNDDGLLLLGLSTDKSRVTKSDARHDKDRVTEVGATLDIRRIARRAYPGYVLADPDLWIEIQGETQANMALSPEESGILEGARTRTNPFPLFINGRAGSGKSTILQYLFAAFTRVYLKSAARHTVDPPIYLTANVELLRTAKERVERLIRLDHGVGSAADSDHFSELPKSIESAFRDFHSYELALLTQEERRTKFQSAHRIEYASFRNRWADKFGQQPDAREKYGPELSWHVIRTYIKGMSPDDFLDIHEYLQLPSAQQTVSQATYELVYDKVWKAWYRDLIDRDGYWDDQDLARFILENERAAARHPAVFCDEAQDFTRIELELLLQINLFSARDLSPEELGKVCFVFAGDQFQTLNPTGFRWEAVKATFVEKFVHEMDHGRKTRPGLNYTELEYNYRSTEKIVRFSNAVQAYRASQFHLPELRPQQPWSSGMGPLGVDYFFSSDGEFWRRYRELKGIVVIVPCAEGDERRYVENDEALRQHVVISDGVPSNVFSASRAKGCEYQAVVVYGFGAFLLKSRTLTESSISPLESRDTALEFEYFINRLYVAVSRAKRRLIIVDSEKSFGSLWSFATETDGFERLWRKWEKGRDVWPGNIEGMRPGIHANLDEATSVDPSDLAKNFKSEGKARRDPYYMRQAANMFAATGDVAEQAQCTAIAFEYEERYVEAGVAYEKGGYSKDAMRMYWRGDSQGWEQLERYSMASLSIKEEPEVKVINAINTPRNGKRWRDALNLIEAGACDRETADRFLNSREWGKAADTLVARWLAEKGAVDSEFPPGAAYSVAGRLRKAGIAISDRNYAEVCVAAAQFSEAVAIYEKAKLTSEKGYADAKVKSTAYPENLFPLHKSKAFGDIVAAYRASSGTSLTTEQAAIVFTALISEGHRTDAIRIGWEYGLAKEFNKLVTASSDLAEHDRRAALHGMVRGFILLPQWDGVGFLCDRGYRISKEFKENFSPWEKNDDPFLKICFIREWARIAARPSAPANAMTVIQKMLKRYGDGLLQGATFEGLSFEELAAAIERADKYVDMRDFYAGVRSPPFSLREKLLARDRSLVVKNRTLKAMLERGGENGQTRALARELQRGLASASIKSVSDLDELLKVDPVNFDYFQNSDDRSTTKIPPSGDSTPLVASETKSPELQVHTAAPPELEKIALRGLEIEFSRRLMRLNLKHIETMQTSYFLVEKGEVGGEQRFVKEEGGAFRCADWGITLRAVKSDTSSRVLLEFRGAFLGLDFDA
jgi:hypothetical protein